MEDILREIIGMEREIRERVERERRECEEWLHRVRNEADEAVGREEARLREEHEAAVETAKGAAGRGAEEAVDNASAYAARLDGMGDDILQAILMGHLAGIGPGRRHDSQDVEG